MKTALEILIDFAKTKIYNTDGPALIIQKAESLLEKEKQQIIDAVKYGFTDAHEVNPDKTFDNYYENTYPQ